VSGSASSPSRSATPSTSTQAGRRSARYSSTPTRGYAQPPCSPRWVTAASAIPPTAPWPLTPANARSPSNPAKANTPSSAGRVTTAYANRSAPCPTPAAATTPGRPTSTTAPAPAAPATPTPPASSDAPAARSSGASGTTTTPTTPYSTPPSSDSPQPEVDTGGLVPL